MLKESEDEKIKLGYLKNDFEFFHIKDKKNLDFAFHYHDFNKIIIFISGKVTYMIEGKAYNLKPWDILLVPSSQVHKPLIDGGGTYERIVIWVNSAFLIKHNSETCNLLTCFEQASARKLNLMRLNVEHLKQIKNNLFQLEDACRGEDFGWQILRNALFIQFIVHLNRLYIGSENHQTTGDIVYDEQIEAVLAHINEHLTSDLSIDNLAALFFMSKYHLMHKFKQQTGYTVHNYILQKRLIAANHLIKHGQTITDACIECGFGDYANFVRSFKKMYGLSPKKHFKALLQLEKGYEAQSHVKKDVSKSTT